MLQMNVDGGMDMIDGSECMTDIRKTTLSKPDEPDTKKVGASPQCDMIT